MIPIRTLACFSLLAVTEASGQLLADTTFGWQGYDTVSTCRVRLYRSGPRAKRPLTVVLDELADNRGRSTLDDARHLVEMISRAYRVRPDSAFWVFHWGSFSFPNASPVRKEFHLRATFRRSDGGSLGSPFWRLVDRETVREYTDRAYR